MTDRFPDYPSEPEPQTFRADLGPPRGPGRWRAILAWIIGGLLILTLLAAWGWKTYLSDLPQVPAASVLWSANRTPAIRFLDRNGQTVASRGPRLGERVTLPSLPAYVPRAFLAAEDRRYYQHGAVDVIGMIRALRANAKAGSVVQGGSTISQQIAKTLLLTPAPTLKRKLQEAVLAWRLERMLGKDKVLELYLNRVFFGANAYGVDAAAQTYFGKPAAALTLPEAALLAALPRAPSRLEPTRDLGSAVARSHMVLERMASEGWITKAALAKALSTPPRLVMETPSEGDYGYALDLASAQAAQLTGGRVPDLVVRLTIDPQLQTNAATIVRRVMLTTGAQSGAEQAALVTLGPDGAIRALVGGVDHSYSPFDRATQARRQPGSAFKPFVYAAALEAGVKPGDTRLDAPVRLGPWSPQNYGGGYRGQVTVEEALAQSINTVAVRLGQEAGADKVADLARRFGVGGLPAKPDLSIALGAYEVTLLDLTAGYQVFQQDGRRQPPYLIETIDTGGGQPLYRHGGAGGLRVYDQGRAGAMVAMMRGVIEHGTGKRAAFGRPAAGKTGTTQSWRDAWFVGFTPEWVTGVWVGNDDNRPMDKVTGGAIPAEIWRRFMMVVHQGLAASEFGGAPAGAIGPVPAGDARAAFYRDLAQAFADTAASAPSSSAPPEPAPAIRSKP